MNDILIIAAAAWAEGAAAIAALGWIAAARRAAERMRERALAAEAALRSEAEDTVFWCTIAGEERDRADQLYRRLVRANALTPTEKAEHFRKLGALGNASRKQRDAA